MDVKYLNMQVALNPLVRLLWHGMLSKHATYRRAVLLHWPRYADDVKHGSGLPT